MKIKNSVLVILIAIFLIANIYLFIRYQTRMKVERYTPPTQLPGVKSGEIAPAFVLKDLEGKTHSTDELEGKTTLLIFCDIENEKSFLDAYYYKLLLGKYKDRGFAIWIISDAKGEIDAKDLNQTYAPILILKDGDSRVTKRYCDKRIGNFQVFLVGSDGVVKARDYNVPNLLMRMMVEKFVLAGEEILGKDEFAEGGKVPSLRYYEVNGNSLKELKEFNGRPILLTFFSANCPTCKDHKRLAFLRWAHQEYGLQGLKVVLIYGRDNPSSIIRDYAHMTGLSFDVGIRKVDSEKLDDYYQSYDLKVDPKSIIIDSDGKVIFVEGIEDNQESIKKELEYLFKIANK